MTKVCLPGRVRSRKCTAQLMPQHCYTTCSHLNGFCLAYVGGCCHRRTNRTPPLRLISDRASPLARGTEGTCVLSLHCMATRWSRQMIIAKLTCSTLPDAEGPWLCFCRQTAFTSGAIPRWWVSSNSSCRDFWFYHIARSRTLGDAGQVVSQ